MFQLTRKTSCRIAVSNKKDTDKSRNEISNEFIKAVTENSSNLEKQWIGYGIKTSLAFGALLLNKDTASQMIKNNISIIKNRKLKIPRNGGMNIANILNNISNCLSFNSAVCLDDLNTQELKDSMFKLYNLCSVVTGYSVQEILNMGHQYHKHDVPCGWEITTNHEDTLVHDANINFKEYVNPEDYIPTLQTRLVIAYSNWVEGDAPNKFSLTINSVKELREYFKSLGAIIKEDIADASVAFNEEKVPLVSENGDVRM